MAYTGGQLNLLNGKMGISAPQNSVPIIKLINNHNPKTNDELYNLINYHYHNDCPCGVKSKGTVEDFGKNLYNSQLRYWGQYRYVLKECIQWEYDLFVVQSLKGKVIEDDAITKFSVSLPNLIIEKTNNYIDAELRIDLIIKDKEKIIAGIQIKPESFNKMRNEVIDFNNKRNKQWEHPVLYLYYNDNGFININELIDKINHTISFTDI
jgi:hypothetical protein